MGEESAGLDGEGFNAWGVTGGGVIAGRFHFQEGERNQGEKKMLTRGTLLAVRERGERGWAGFPGWLGWLGPGHGPGWAVLFFSFFCSGFFFFFYSDFCFWF
jgi:hypothetical protein